MKFKSFFSLFVVATILTSTGCVQSNNSSNSVNEQSSHSSSQNIQSSSKSSTSNQSSTTTTTSTKPKEEARPEVMEKLIKLESLKKGANDKYTEMANKYGSRSKFPSADIQEWNKRLTEYQACLKELNAIDLNSEEWAYYRTISDIKLLP